MAAPPTIARLTQGELDFVNNQVNAGFLHKYGTSGGFGMFCKLATQQGFKCANGTGPQSKSSYASYLKNATTGGGVTLWSQMVGDYNDLDGFTKASMAKAIGKGKALKPPQPFQSGCFKNFTVSDLKDIAEMAGVKVHGNKAQICGQLQKAGVDPTALWGAGSQSVSIQSIAAPGKGKAAWEAYARATKKRGVKAPKTYAGALAEAAKKFSDDPSTLTPAELAFLQSLNNQ